MAVDRNVKRLSVSFCHHWKYLDIQHKVTHFLLPSVYDAYLQHSRRLCVKLFENFLVVDLKRRSETASVSKSCTACSLCGE